MTKKKKTDK